MAQTARDIAAGYWKAEGERDTEKVLAFYHKDAVFCPPGQRLVGHEQIAGFYDASAAAFPGLEVAIVNDFTVGDQTALEFDAILTSVDGKKYRVLGVNIVKIREGKFESVHSYFDPNILQAEEIK